MDPEVAARVLHWAYRECTINGYAIAKKGRAELESQKGTKISSLTYGEISIPSFITLIRALTVVGGGDFVDIGSGTGKAVLAAALCLPLKRATGAPSASPQETGQR
jgi:hypothetical protein